MKSCFVVLLCVTLGRRVAGTCLHPLVMPTVSVFCEPVIPGASNNLCAYNGFPKLQVRNGTIDGVQSLGYYRLTFIADQKHMSGFRGVDFSFLTKITTFTDGTDRGDIMTSFYGGDNMKTTIWDVDGNVYEFDNPSEETSEQFSFSNNALPYAYRKVGSQIQMVQFSIEIYDDSTTDQRVVDGNGDRIPLSRHVAWEIKNYNMCCDESDTWASDLSMCSVTKSVVAGPYEYTTLDFNSARVDNTLLFSIQGNSGFLAMM